MPFLIFTLLAGAAAGAWMLASLWGAMLLGSLAMVWLVCIGVATGVTISKLRRSMIQTKLYKEEFQVGVAAATDVLLDKLYTFARIDDRVLDALIFSSAHKDLPSLIENASLASDVPGAIERIKGYVGEQTVAEQLAQQGFVVSMPESPTQEGYDIFIDGDAFQIKTTLSEAYISSALAANPDIPVIVPEELAASALASTPNIHFVPGFRFDEVSAITTDNLDELASLADVFGHIPIITSLIIGRKEFLAVQNRGKAVSAAVADTALGVAGSTIGSAAGGAVGLTVGGAAAAAGVGGVVSWGTAAAVGGTLTTAIGGKAGAIAGGAALLVLGPLGAIGVAVGGAFGGAALGRFLVQKWQLRGVEEKREKALSAMWKLGSILADALQKRIDALESKLAVFNARYIFPPWLDAILPLSGSMIRTGIRLRFQQEIQTLKERHMRLQHPLPADELFQLLQNNPVFSQTLDTHMAVFSRCQREYQDILKKRGLVASAA